MKQQCPAFSNLVVCTSGNECQLSCILEASCSLGERFTACVRARCTAAPSDAGSPDAASVEGDPEREAGNEGEGEGQGEIDPEAEDAGSTGKGGPGCSHETPYSCTCIPGTKDDGKGCSPSSLAAKGACCRTDTRCRCQSLICTSNSAGCSCILGGAASSSTSCSGPLCCRFAATSTRPGSCQCFNKPGTGGCAAMGGSTVSSCTPSNVACYYKEERSTATCP